MKIMGNIPLDGKGSEQIIIELRSLADQIESKKIYLGDANLHSEYKNYFDPNVLDGVIDIHLEFSKLRRESE